jgi:hypothetical protein
MITLPDPHECRAEIASLGGVFRIHERYANRCYLDKLRIQVRDLYGSLGSFFACLMSAETTVCVSLLTTFTNIT